MNEMNSFKDVSDKLTKRFENSSLGKLTETAETKSDNYDSPIVKATKDSAQNKQDGTKEEQEVEKKEPIQNKLDGIRREQEVDKELEKKYPPEQGYSILSEKWLLDKDGNIVKDPETGKARRIDFVVVKDGKVVDSVEVTSKTADKTEQTQKEERIRANGGTYIRDNDGNIIKIPENVKTRIERRD